MCRRLINILLILIFVLYVAVIPTYAVNGNFYDTISQASDNNDGINSDESLYDYSQLSSEENSNNPEIENNDNGQESSDGENREDIDTENGNIDEGEDNSLTEEEKNVKAICAEIMQILSGQFGVSVVQSVSNVVLVSFPNSNSGNENGGDNGQEQNTGNDNGGDNGQEQNPGNDNGSDNGQEQNPGNENNDGGDNGQEQNPGNENGGDNGQEQNPGNDNGGDNGQEQNPGNDNGQEQNPGNENNDGGDNGQEQNPGNENGGDNGQEQNPGNENNDSGDNGQEQNPGNENGGDNGQEQNPGNENNGENNGNDDAEDPFDGENINPGTDENAGNDTNDYRQKIKQEFNIDIKDGDSTWNEESLKITYETYKELPEWYRSLALSIIRDKEYTTQNGENERSETVLGYVIRLERDIHIMDACVEDISDEDRQEIRGYFENCYREDFINDLNRYGVEPTEEQISNYLSSEDIQNEINKYTEKYIEEVKEDTLKHTLIHETAHCLHNTYPTYFRQWQQKFWASGTAAEGCPTAYGKSAPAEDFAESFSYYLQSGGVRNEDGSISYSDTQVDITISKERVDFIEQIINEISAQYANNGNSHDI